MRRARSGLSVAVVLLIRLAATAICAQQGAAAASHGGAWWALAVVLEALALFGLAVIGGMVWAFIDEHRFG